MVRESDISPDTPFPDDAPVEVRFSLTKSLWFDMIFVAGRQGRIVETAHTVWNIGELFDWLKALACGDAVAVMEPDREGQTDLVEAYRVDEKRVRLVIREGGAEAGEDDALFLDAVVSRRKLAWEVYYELRSLAPQLGDHYKPEFRQTDPDWTRIPEVEA